MKALVTFFFMFTAFTFGQFFEPKQITFSEYDCRNAVFSPMPIYSGYLGREIFFEVIKDDSTVSIYSLIYDPGIDSFYNVIQISSDSFINRNVICILVDEFPDEHKLLLWETNLNGNWDIAFSTNNGSGWSIPQLFSSSSEDELHPSNILGDGGFSIRDKFVYSKGNSVFLYSDEDSVANELIFEGNDSIKYSYPTGAVSQYNGDLYLVAVREILHYETSLVFRKLSLNDSTWSEIRRISDVTNVSKPKFTNPGWEDVHLSFEVNTGAIKKVYLIEPIFFEILGAEFELMDDTTLETSDFSAIFYPIITEPPIEDYYTFSPFSFRFVRNDSSFIRTGWSGYRNFYEDIYTKVPDSKPSLGAVYISDIAVSYTIWEDSAKGKINLFGLKRLDPVDINNEVNPYKEFSLSQNYPNPFNPSTNIQYAVSSKELVILKVYDVLGREVTTLVNEEKHPGVYEIEFDAAGLASGIYYYQLKAGRYIVTKKMLLIK